MIGISEAEERKRFVELYSYVVELTKYLNRDQYIASSAMIINHILFKKQSLKAASLLVVASASVFLAAKVRSMPFELAKAAWAYFQLERKLQASSVVATAPNGRGSNILGAAAFTAVRESHYKEMIEAEERRILEAIAYDFEPLENLPYGIVH